MVTPMRKQYKEAMLEIENQPRRKGGKFIRHILPAERNAVILWGIYQGWSAVVIGHKIKQSSHTVQKIIQQLNAEPALIFRLPVLYMRYKNRDRLFICAFCGSEMLKIREKTAREHVASHVFTEQMIKEGGVFFS